MKGYDFFEDYVTIKSEQLIEMMNDLISLMNCKKCNVRHFKQWEAQMTSFKEEYHLFQSNLLNRLNDVQDARYAKQLETVIAPICDNLEDHYEMLASIYLAKCNEIQEKTTYFENLQFKTNETNPIDKLFKRIKLPIIKVSIEKRK